MHELFTFDHSSTHYVETKKCTQCLQNLSLDCFGNDSGANYLRGKCKQCEKQNSKGTATLRKIYTPPTNPEYRCPICLLSSKDLIDKGYKPKWCLDHDHDSGVFRGYICNLCNTGISNLKENVETMRRAVAYLESHAVIHYTNTAKIYNRIDDFND